jgi:hypothetical protein
MGPGLLPALLVLGIVLAATFQLGWLLARRGRIWSLVQTLAAGMGVTAIAASTLVLPRFDAVKSARPLAAKLIDSAAADEPWAIWPRLDATFLFHTRRRAVELATEGDLYAFARRPERVWLLITRDELAKLPEPLPLVEVARDAEVSRGYVLLASLP